jgi:hypothetical protein
LAPKYTQQDTEQGSRQYLQPFAGCRHIQILEVITAVTANRNVTVSIYKKIQTKIKAGGQAILTEHPVSGTHFLWTHSNVMGGIDRRRQGCNISWTVSALLLLIGPGQGKTMQGKTRQELGIVSKVVVLVTRQENE